MYLTSNDQQESPDLTVVVKVKLNRAVVLQDQRVVDTASSLK